MNKFVDMTGWKMWEHGVINSKLIVVKRAPDRLYPNGRRIVRWECKCSCGSEKQIIVTARDLRRGHSKSCGCIRTENVIKKCSTHRETDSRLYHIWCGIKSRCLNKNNNKYKNYGGRGITVCDEWLNSYESFRDWAIQHGYSDELSIDRVDVNGNYAPNNCRWVNAFVQANNRTDNFVIEHNNEKHTLHEWALITNISAENIYNRIKHLNWSITDALTIPVKSIRRNL